MATLKSLLLAALLLPVTSLPAQSTPPLAVVRPSGPIQMVFNWSRQKCTPDDIPDDGARAFRDATGTVHLVASHYINWAFTGKDLSHVAKDCNVIYQDRLSPDPKAFDDMGWLEAFYTLDGKTVHGLVSLDYHPQRHNLPCDSKPPIPGACWYSTITQATSTDGGYHFVSPPPGEPRVVATSPYKFDPAHPNPTGYFVVSNIVAWKGAWYAFISASEDRAQKGGACLLRTDDLVPRNAWRAWDGTGFHVGFVDPYTTPVMTAEKHVCTPVGGGALVQPVRSLLALADGRGFLVTMLGGVDKPDGRHFKTVLVSTSPDLLHWSAPQVVMDFLDTPVPQCRTDKSPHYSYPALLDENSPTRNFETVGKSGYIYMTQSIGCGSLDRNLVRLPVTVEEK